MSESPLRDEVAKLLDELKAGREGAGEELLPLVYDELRTLAHAHMRGERTGHTLQTTALVHEAYLRLRGHLDVEWRDRSHFMRIAARAMRQVLIDHARRKRADKRGGGRAQEPLDQVVVALEGASTDLLALDAALDRLSEIDARTGHVVELRFFGGLTIEETAEVLGISPGTVKNEWALARSWLREQVSD